MWKMFSSLPASFPRCPLGPSKLPEHRDQDLLFGNQSGAVPSSVLRLVSVWGQKQQVLWLGMGVLWTLPSTALEIQWTRVSSNLPGWQACHTEAGVAGQDFSGDTLLGPVLNSKGCVYVCVCVFLCVQ
jgi:hypothetical protein